MTALTVTIRVAQSFDGTTLFGGVGVNMLTLEAGTTATWFASTVAPSLISAVGFVRISEIDRLGSGESGLLNGTAFRVPYVQYAGAATQVSIAVGIMIGGILQIVGPWQIFNPSVSALDCAVGLALPTLDHGLVVVSNVIGGQEISFCLQEVEAATDFTAAFATPVAGPNVVPTNVLPFTTTIATAAVAIGVNTTQLYNPTGGAFAVTAPAPTSPNSRFAIKNTTASVNVLTVTATGGATIENPTTGVIGAAATFAASAGRATWQLDPNTAVGSPIWRVVTSP